MLARSEPIDVAIDRALVEWRRAAAAARTGLRTACPTDGTPAASLLMLPWVLLLAPHTSSTATAQRAAQILPRQQPTVCYDIGDDAAAADGGAGDASLPLLVVQLLPTVGGVARAARHREAAVAGGITDVFSSEPWWRHAHVALPDATGRFYLYFSDVGVHADSVLVRPDRVVFGTYALEELPDALRRAAADITMMQQRGAAPGQRRRALVAWWLVAMLAAALAALARNLRQARPYLLSCVAAAGAAWVAHLVVQRYSENSA